MASVSITRRRTKDGRPRYWVRYRLGGRYTPGMNGGSFRTEREARVRRDLIAGELAACRNPADLLARMAEPPARRATVAELAPRYKASRLDASDETLRNMDSHLRRILPAFGEREPQEIGWGDVQDWVAAIAAPGELKPTSVTRYMATLRLLLDYAGVDPNPARDPRVKLPTIVVEEPTPPDAEQLLAILDAVPKRRVLPLLVMEQTAMAVGETASLAWGDVDVTGCRFRLRRSTVKGAIRARARWVQLPAWLMDGIAYSCPLEDRTAERRVFAGLTEDAARAAMARACRAAGVPLFGPHDLRHRRLTIWHHEGVPARVASDRAGHTRTSMTLEVYTHVLHPGEVPADVLRARMWLSLGADDPGPARVKAPTTEGGFR